MSIDLNAALAVAEGLARRAGALLLEGLQKPRHVDYKGAVNLVTEYDGQSEALIVRGLLENFPDHHVVGEEGGGKGAPIEAAPYRWYIDPLDGTTNYAHGIPYFSVSIALAGPDDVPLLGLVYDPTRDECFRAVRGQGATRNGQPMHVSTVADLSRAAIVTGFPFDRRTNPDNNLAQWGDFLVRAQSVSRMGSAALDLSYVAAGRFDGFWEMCLNPWDVQAGMLCVLEAGGRISDYRGQTGALYRGRQVVASNGLIHEQILAVIDLGDAAPRPDKA
jgi:myo-inositol-1(or 4)-monophosphatase